LHIFAASVTSVAPFSQFQFVQKPTVSPSVWVSRLVPGIALGYNVLAANGCEWLRVAASGCERLRVAASGQTQSIEIVEEKKGFGRKTIFFQVWRVDS